MCDVRRYPAQFISRVTEQDRSLKICTYQYMGYPQRICGLHGILRPYEHLQYERRNLIITIIIEGFYTYICLYRVHKWLILRCVVR